MKFLIIISVVFLLGGSFLIELVKNDSGYVLISIGGWTFESSFWVGILLFFLFCFILWFVFWGIKRGVKKVGSGLNWFSEARDKSTIKRTQKGLIHYIEGNWLAAKKELLGAAKKTELPLVHYLAAARSASELGLNDESHFLLQQAEKASPENELAIALSQARIQLLNKEYEHCLATLNKIKTTAINNPVLLDLLKKVYIQLQDWESLIELIPRLKKSKIVSIDTLFSLEKNAYQSLLVQNFENASLDQKEKALTETWQLIPKVQKKDGAIIATYVRYLLDMEKVEKAELVIRNTLSHSWHHELLNLYSELNGGNLKERLIVAEAWLRDHPGDALLLRVLGKIAKANKLWGKSKSYYEDSLKLRDDPQTYLDLANLLSELGEYQQSTELYKKGLMLKV